MGNWVGGLAGQILDPLIGIAAFLLFSWITVRFGTEIAAAIIKVGLAFVLILGPLMIFAPFLFASPIWLLAPVALIGFALYLMADMF
jgi:hypothetical protein